MSLLKNDRLLRAIRREPVDMTPVWIMRQAGRYLPEYRRVREEAKSFMNLCKTPALACEVTLQPLRRFPLDAAIIFSDILTIPDAMGLGLHFIEGEGPHFAHPIRLEKEIKRLNAPDFAQLNYVYETIALAKRELNGQVPLIGFCGSPWTLAAYMVEGRSNPGFPLLINMLQSEPSLLHQLLQTLSEAVSAHLNAQIKAGADVVMLFDTWGGLLKSEQYELFSLSYLKEIIKNIKQANPNTPIILFAKGGASFLSQMVTAGCDVLGIDWEISLKNARQLVGDQVALQGNLHPEVLLKGPDVIRKEVKQVLDSFGEGSGHIFNLGHGITPDVPPAHVACLVDAVHDQSKVS